MKVFVPEDLLKEIEDNIYVKKLKIGIFAYFN